MNKNYRSIYNEQMNTWVAVSEITAACGKKSAEKTTTVIISTASMPSESVSIGRKLLSLTLALALGGISLNAAAEAGTAGGTRPGGNSGTTVMSPSDAECDASGSATAQNQANAVGVRSVAIGCGVNSGNDSVTIGAGAGSTTSAFSTDLGREAGRNINGR